MRTERTEMMTVHIYGADGEHLGAWYPEEDQVQVPRKGDVVWLETDAMPFDRWRVKRVEWSFQSKRHGIGSTRRISVEVHVTPSSTKPLWRRFVELFPRTA